MQGKLRYLDIRMCLEEKEVMFISRKMHLEFVIQILTLMVEYLYFNLAWHSCHMYSGFLLSLLTGSAIIVIILIVETGFPGRDGVSYRINCLIKSHSELFSRVSKESTLLKMRRTHH